MNENKPTILIYDALTGEEIIREMTNEEIQTILNPSPNYLPSEKTAENE